MRDKFGFLYIGVWFNVTKCNFIVKNSSFKMLVMFSIIIVADTKVAFVYNFVAPLMKKKKKLDTAEEINRMGNFGFSQTPDVFNKGVIIKNFAIFTGK